MRLFLLRHAEAVDHPRDEARALSAFGRRSLEPLADLVRVQGRLHEVEIWHSPLVRAVETARLFAQRLGWKTFTPLARAGLRPEDDPTDLVPLLSVRAGDLLLVGHEPFLSGLATVLLTGTVYPPKVIMEKASLLCLERIGSGPHVFWSVRWHLPGSDSGRS